MAQKRPRCQYPSCGKQFRAKRSTKRYCADACSLAHRRQRQVEETENEHRLVQTNEHVQKDYTQLAGYFKQKQQKRSTDKPMTDEEFMDKWMRENMPDGPPRVIRPAPVAPDDEGIHVTIKNMPTRFPGTPLSRGRQG